MLFLPKLTAIKLIPITFDLFNAVLVYQIVKTKYGREWEVLARIFGLGVAHGNDQWFLLGAGGRTVYLLFLISLLCLLSERPIGAILAFSVSFSIKAQAVFFCPFWQFCFFKQKIRWQYFLLIPPVYFLMMLPAALAGRSLSSLALAYVKTVMLCPSIHECRHALFSAAAKCLSHVGVDRDSTGRNIAPDLGSVLWEKALCDPSQADTGFCSPVIGIDPISSPQNA